MSGEEGIKKLPLRSIFNDAAACFEANLTVMISFTLVNYLSLVAGVYSWKSIWFWPLLMVVYLFWSYFFRYYFKRQPYLLLKPIVSSLIPSTKIVVLTVIFASLLIVLPFAPLFLGFSAQFNDRYMQFLQNYMMESDYVDLGLNLLVVIVSPWIFYRPFLAWIAALIGRSGSLKSAWNRSQGNYFEFLLMAIVFNLSFLAVQQFSELVNAPLALMLVLLSPLVVYFNLVLAKTYEFFFMDFD